MDPFSEDDLFKVGFNKRWKLLQNYFKHILIGSGF